MTAWNLLKGKESINQADETRGVLKLLWMWGILLTFIVLFVYGKVLVAMITQWWSDDMYSYCFLIPLISFYLIWIRRDNLRHIRLTSNYIAGSGILIFGLFVLIVGHAGGILALQELSLIPTIVGIVLIFFGKPLLQAIQMPIAYLLLMIPVWDILTDQLHRPFQNLSAQIGVTILEMIGVPVHRQGLYLELPNITLEVAKVCSGVNYLVAVIALGLPMAYLFLCGWRRRVILILSAILIAIFANGLRVAFIGALSYSGYGGDLHGPYHILQGLTVSFIGYGALIGGVWALSQPQPPISMKLAQLSTVSAQPPPRKREINYLGSFVIFIFLPMGGYIQFYEPIPIPLKIDLRYIPLQLGEWRGRDTDNFSKLYTGVDHELSRIYQDSSGEMIHLYIGYFERQQHDRKLIHFDNETKTLHRNASKIEIAFATQDPIKINKVVRRNGRQNTLILYWYDMGGLIVTDPYIAKAYTARDSLLHRTSNGAVILVTTTFKNPEESERALLRSETFIQVISPFLQKHLPERRTL